MKITSLTELNILFILTRNEHWSFEGQGPLWMCVLFKTLCLPYWLKYNRSVNIMLNIELQLVLSPFPLFLSRLSFFLKWFPPLPPTIFWHWLNLTALQVFSVRSSYPFLGSHNRKAGWLNRFSVVPSASAYLVHWSLCNCYYFEKAFLFHLDTQII